MENKFRSLFWNNAGLKLIGILLALVLWLMLSNTQDPVVASSVSVPIVYDETGLESRNLMAISKPTTVTIPVQVRKSRLRYLSAEDFTVTANLTEVIGEIKDAPEATKINLEITKSPSATYIQSWQYPQSQSYIRVTLDKIKTEVYVIQFNLGKELPEGYQLGELSCSPSRVKVTGPTSDFTNLATVRATVDLSLLSEGNPCITAPLGLYDGNNRLLTSGRLKLSRDSVEVSVGLNQMKEISVSIAAYSGTPAPGYVVSRVDYSPKLIQICGTQNALANISTIIIPSSELNISGADSSMEFQIDVSSYLPDDITLAEGQSAQILVQIELEQLQLKEYRIKPEQLQLLHTSDQYEYEILSSEVAISLEALKADLDSLNESDIKGAVDVSGLTPGEHSVPIVFDLDHAYTLKNEAVVAIRISEKESVTVSTEETTAGSSETVEDTTASDNSEEETSIPQTSEAASENLSEAESSAQAQQSSEAVSAASGAN